MDVRGANINIRLTHPAEFMKKGKEFKKKNKNNILTV